MSDGPERKKVRSLSSGVQGMRFMQRKREREVRHSLQEERKAPRRDTAAAPAAAPAPVNGAPPVILKGKGVCVIEETTYGDDAVIGRRSFKKFNPAFDGGRGYDRSAQNSNVALRQEQEAGLSAAEIARWREKYVSGAKVKEKVSGAKPGSRQ